MQYVWESPKPSAFLINIVLNTQELSADFSCFDGVKICLVCQANMYYKNYQWKLYEKCLDLNFLADVRENVYHNLSKLLTLDSHFVCKIVNQDFQYSHKDWFTGEKMRYDLDVCLTMWEQKKIDEIIANDCEVILSPI